MFCKYCCKYEKAGSFVVGFLALGLGLVFKLESIKVHNSSASHMRLQREKAESNPGSSVADKTMDQLGIITDIGDIDDDSDESEMDEDEVAQILKDFIHGHCLGTLWRTRESSPAAVDNVQNLGT